MKKQLCAAMIAAAAALVMSSTALAGTWKSDATGFWYQNDDGTYPVSSWKWIDGDGDGSAECFYFNGHGYLVTGTTIDGSDVNASGAWTVNGVVQTRPLYQVQPSASDSSAKVWDDSKNMFENIFGMRYDFFDGVYFSDSGMKWDDARKMIEDRLGIMFSDENSIRRDISETKQHWYDLVEQEQRRTGKKDVTWGTFDIINISIFYALGGMTEDDLEALNIPVEQAEEILYQIGVPGYASTGYVLDQNTKSKANKIAVK